jgi:outer membrane translocation and assembly module TamA
LNLRPLLSAIFLVLIASAAFSAQPTLQYKITGLTQEALENAGDYLGSPPDSVYERSNFLFSARKQVEQSLNALGYYHPVVEMQVDREKPVWQLLIRVDPGARVHITEVDVRIDGQAENDPAFDKLLEEIPLVAGGTCTTATTKISKKTCSGLPAPEVISKENFSDTRFQSMLTLRKRWLNCTTIAVNGIALVR